MPLPEVDLKAHPKQCIVTLDHCTICKYSYLLTYLLTYLFTWFLGLIRVHIQTVPQSVQPFLCGSRMCPIDRYTHMHARTHARMHTQTHTQTDHGTSVTVGHIPMLCTVCDVIIMNASVLCKIDKNPSDVQIMEYYFSKQSLRCNTDVRTNKYCI